MGSFVNEMGSNVSDFVAGLDEYSSDRELANVVLFKDYPEALLRFSSACCILFMLIGIPGNLVTIIALAQCRKVRMSIYLINCLSSFTICPPVEQISRT